MSAVKRSNEVDVIRMAALIGICVVNVPFMALPIESVFIPLDNWQDESAVFLVKFFFQLKFFLLFSFIFGWGMAIQSKSVKSQGQSFRRYYFRRMAGLALLGVVHAILVFSGDILLLYAILGLLLWLIKDFTSRQLIKIAIWIALLNVLFFPIFAILFGDIETGTTTTSITAGNLGLSGGFIEATQARMKDWFPTFGLLFFLQGPLAFAAFSMGLAAAKTDFFSANSDGFNLLKQRLPLLIAIALPLNILYAIADSAMLENYEILSLLGFVFITVGAPALSLIYLYLFIRFSRIVKMPHLLVLAGQNSLSSYVAQGVLAGFIFGAYGLGFFNTLGHADLVLLSLIIALVAMLFVGVYAKIFGRGPLEPILRKISSS